MSETLGDMYAAYFSARVAKGGVPFTYERWLESELTAANERAANLKAKIAACLAIMPYTSGLELEEHGRGYNAALTDVKAQLADDNR